MQILMVKEKEDRNFVWYKFEIKVPNKEISECNQGKYIIKTGVFKFNKSINLDEDPSINIKDMLMIERNKTDQYFWQHPRFFAICLAKMTALKKDDKFLDRFSVALCEDL